MATTKLLITQIFEEQKFKGVMSTKSQVLAHQSLFFSRSMKINEADSVTVQFSSSSKIDK